MPGYIKEVIVFVVGAGAIVLIYQGVTDAGIALLSTLAGFYAGEQVGKRQTT